MNPPSVPCAPCADSGPCDEQIRAYAYHLYEQSNCAPGRDVENWLEAAACLRANIPARESGMRLHRHLSEHGHSSSSAIGVGAGSTRPSAGTSLQAAATYCNN